MLNRDEVVKRMDEREFSLHAVMGGTKLHFISKNMYRLNVGRREPVINVIVNLENGHFEGIYAVCRSINTLRTPECSPVLDDKQFNSIIGKLELQAKWMQRLETYGEE